ncbi:MAG: hypothetical protein ACJ73L_11970 [Actinomycetes bacterium]
MKRHAFDMTSFLFGIVLGTAAVGFMLAEQLSWDVDGRWVLPTALILLGIVGIAGAFSGLRPSRQSPESSEEEAEKLADRSQVEDVEDVTSESTTDDLKSL